MVIRNISAVVLASVLVLMLMAMPVALADPGTSVSIEAAFVVTIGGNADVQLRINTDEANGIGSATITLTVDMSVVEVVDVAGGDLGTVYWNTVGGTTTMSAATGSSPGPGWDGSTVTFATITLNAEGTGGECSDVDIEVASMYDATAGDPQKIIPDPVTDCEFCIGIGTPRLEGDVYPLGSGDGVINSADFQLVAQHIVYTTTLTGDDFLAADVNDSGTVDAADLQLVAQYLIGTIIEFPRPTPTPTPTPNPLPIIPMSCVQARDAIQDALGAYNTEYGEWPTADGQPGDIEWTKLVPEFMAGIPSIDSTCDWWVNSDPEGDACLQYMC